MRDDDFEPCALKDRFEAVQRSVELDCADCCDCLPRLEIAFEGRDEVGCVDADVHKNIQGFDSRDIHGDQTTVCIMHQKIAAKRARGVIVYAAGAVRNVPHDERFDAIAEFGEDV